jgi:hypothetical protein
MLTVHNPDRFLRFGSGPRTVLRRLGVIATKSYPWAQYLMVCRFLAERAGCSLRTVDCAFRQEGC